MLPSIAIYNKYQEQSLPLNSLRENSDLSLKYNGLHIYVSQRNLDFSDILLFSCEHEVIFLFSLAYKKCLLLFILTI